MIRVSHVLNLLGKLLLYFSFILFLPMIASCLDGFRSLSPFVFTFLITITVSLVLIFSFEKPEYLTPQDGFLIVTLTWISYAFFGGLPYLFGDVFSTVSDAFFESMSGFTTTGSTVLAQIEGTDNAILFWRSLTQFLGGMGIIVLGIAILPEIGTDAMQLFKAEVPGPTSDRLFPRIKDTALTLWVVYLILTGVEFILLCMSGMTVFEAINHSFTTMATGGFSTCNTSIMGFYNPAVEWVMILFMFMAGVNFILHYNMLRGKPLNYFKSSEFRVYLTIFLIGTALISFNIYPFLADDIGGTIRKASFQAISILTTTGYASVDFESWPELSKMILFLFMFFGAMSGSTGGGIKIIRLQLFFKQGIQQLNKLIHPQAIYPIKIGGSIVSNGILTALAGFLLLYLGTFIIGVVTLAAFGIDFETSTSAVASCLGNIGPGFGTVGAMDNYSHLPNLVKNLLSFLMLIGRLELYTVIVILTPTFWRR